MKRKKRFMLLISLLLVSVLCWLWFAAQSPDWEQSDATLLAIQDDPEAVLSEKDKKLIAKNKEFLLKKLGKAEDFAQYLIQQEGWEQEEAQDWAQQIAQERAQEMAEIFFACKAGRIILVLPKRRFEPDSNGDYFYEVKMLDSKSFLYGVTMGKYGDLYELTRWPWKNRVLYGGLRM